MWLLIAWACSGKELNLPRANPDDYDDGWDAVDSGSYSETGEDADKDGWGLADCNDSDPAVHPLADDICDGIDNDCDNLIDEGPWSEVWPDGDGDGHGDAGGKFVIACPVPDGYALSDDDCDDDNAAAFPGAEEACDGIDNDCDKEVDEDC